MMFKKWFARVVRNGTASLALLSTINYAWSQDSLPEVPPRAALAGVAEVQEKAAPAAPAEEKATPAQACPGSHCSDNSGCCSGCRLPPGPRIFPRMGFFGIPPTGEGYYSLADVVHDNCRKAPPKSPYGTFGLMPFSFFDADWRYLDDPKNTQHDYADCLHQIHLGDCWTFNTGGMTWWRHMHEINSRLSGKNNDYDLWRVRVYGDLWYGDSFRVFVEFIDAQTFNQDLPPLLIDRNFGDLLNAFVDVKVAEIDGHNAYVRIGRQELLLGSQRLISPLDWANTRRTFQGVRGFRQGEKFDVDLFWVQPVIPEAKKFDSADNNINFAGLWTTYRPEKGQFLDMYYLFADNTNRTNAKKNLDLLLAPYNVHTLGTRYAGEKCNFLWDVEGMIQFGQRGQQDILAGNGTAGVGYHFANQPLNPVFWVMYDYASGNYNPNGTGDFGTFNQLFPFGHYYMGWNDNVGRQNIQDFNMHLFLYPTKWITFWTQYHHFWLASNVDALYYPNSVPARRDPSGKAGADVGQEIDFIASFHLSAHSDILVGWNKLFAGDFLQQTGTTAASHRSPETFFFQYSYRW